MERLTHVLQQEGPEGLEAYEVPLLSWDDFQAIKEQPLALPAGSGTDAAATGRLLKSGAGRDTPVRPAEERPPAVCGSTAQHVPPAGPAGPAAGGPAPREEAEQAGSDEGELDGGASEAGSFDGDELFELD